MNAKRFIDTNIFSEDEAKAGAAEAILAAGGCLSVQFLNEFVHVCRRKLNLDWPEIEERLAAVKTLANEIAPLGTEVHEKAVELARGHNFSIYDALIVAAALSLNCTQLVTDSTAAPSMACSSRTLSSVDREMLA